jgi:hypothetical protein
MRVGCSRHARIEMLAFFSMRCVEEEEEEKEEKEEEKEEEEKEHTWFASPNSFHLIEDGGEIDDNQYTIVS